MLPVRAMAFLFARVVPLAYFQDKKAAYYWFYLVLRLVISLGFIKKRDNEFTNKNALISGRY